MRYPYTITTITTITTTVKVTTIIRDDRDGRDGHRQYHRDEHRPATRLLVVGDFTPGWV
jgi:hypothetical protein